MAQSGRDTDATWRSLGVFCRERGWSKSRALYELQNGLRYRAVPALPPGRVVDWHDPAVQHGLNVETGDLALILSVFGGPGLGFDILTASIEVLPPGPPAASVTWAAAAIRDLRDKIPEGATKAKLARLLEAEAKKAVKAGKLTRALKASYLENQLEAWGLFPLK